MTDVRATVALAMRNQAAHCRQLAEHAVGGRVETTEDYVFFAGAHPNPSPHSNGVFRISSRIGAAELVARADAFFGALGRQYFLWTEDGADGDLDALARRRGFAQRPPLDGSPMIIRRSVIEPRPVPDGWTIEDATTDAQRREYLALLARNWDLADASEQVVEEMLFSVASLRSDSIAVHLARSHADGEVHSAGSAFLHAGCMGHEWAATDPMARKLGLGSVLFHRASVWGFERGARASFGVPSQRGVSTWLKLGFDVVSAVRRYLVTPPTADPSEAAPSTGVCSTVRRRRRG